MNEVDRRRRYDELRSQLESLLQGEPDPVARLASAAALIYGAIPRVSFAGFYRVAEPRTLVIGPYQGPPACLRIPFGQGVCGTAALQNRSILVSDVHAFPGHIACDPSSRSELVVPVRGPRGELRAVLDLDSREPAAFDDLDREELERTVELVFSPGEGSVD